MLYSKNMLIPVVYIGTFAILMLMLAVAMLCFGGKIVSGKF